MKVDFDTEVHVHLKHLENSLEGLEDSWGGEEFSSEMDAALSEMYQAFRTFKAAFAESRRKRKNL